MKLCVLGSNGQLGSDMVRCAEDAGHTIIGLDMPQIDVTDFPSLKNALRPSQPDVIINCSAYTAVDDCESNRALAFAVNRTGTANIAQAARDLDCVMVHISTDYVFNGTKQKPYVETDIPNPVSVYGQSKLAGEQEVRRLWPRHFIFRIAWLYGRTGSNFVKTILKCAKNNLVQGKPLRVVNDQRGTPTHTIDVCRQVLNMIVTGEYGLYHCTSEGACTWYDFACYILGKYEIPLAVEPCGTNEYPRPAPRPANSVLENARLGSLGRNIMPPWEKAFDTFHAHNRNLI